MSRSLHAVVLPPGPLLFRHLEAALDGSGPAICPLSPELPAPALSGLLDVLRPSWVETPDGRQRYDCAPGPEVADDTAVLIATSGSTGTPKVVELSATALRHSSSATLTRVAARPGDRWLCCLPTSHIAGIQVLVRSLVAGTDPVIHPRFDVTRVAGSGAAHISVVPTQLRRLIDADVDLRGFRSILLGGAAPPPDLVETARTRGGRIFTTYGMSETCGGCVYDGEPLDGVSVDIGADGRIRLAGPVLFGGYRLRPELTAAVRDGAWFVTQDLGVIEDGRLRVRGRADDVIVTGGEKVVAGEVAAVLARHRGVRDVAVVGRGDPEWGERVTAVVVPGDDPPDLEELRTWVRAELPAYAAPRQLELVGELPLLPSGKPDLERLRRA